ncbi:hypothetical protein LNKW23_18170 [Paralimibaculum aggregatum]|uniref:Uncharacterized protein n=1 Tax=Paralimibaculum aggregatum TaxID=3036245 RepID=A0ABQ6LPK4_9RHOB|nr:hypothetical protein [Limibaculum sp. NKW23]GMG82604.1 hypothetical protein LNKW23_18170 [Limibaculum sp. NKW23]
MAQHRNEAAYPALWRAIDGQIRAACHAHPDIEIPDRRRASIVKRVVGEVLALAAGPAPQGAGDTGPGQVTLGPPSAANLQAAAPGGVLRPAGHPRGRG